MTAANDQTTPIQPISQDLASAKSASSLPTPQALKDVVTRYFTQNLWAQNQALYQQVKDGSLSEDKRGKIRKKQIMEARLQADAGLPDDYPSLYQQIDFQKRDVHLTDYKTGKVLCDMHDLEFPAQYSQQACDIIASKYFRKAGLPPKTKDQPLGAGETSLAQVIDRMAGFWVHQLKNEGFLSAEEGLILYDELAYCFLHQFFAPNSPQWFNTGLMDAYGIPGSDTGLFYYDPKVGKVVHSPDTYTRTQASACFILSITDQLLGANSISDHYVVETKLFKGGSGTGTNFSPLRAEGERLSSGGKSSGLMSFLKGLDRNAGAIKSGGTTRRAAKMVCLDVDHPEIEDFITWKAKEEEKVAALAKMGYDAGFEGEAYQTVSGQNSNNSIQFSDEFMDKVDHLSQDPDASYMLKGRVDSTLDRPESVKKIWDLFNQSAWACADPAPQFSDTFNAWHTCPRGLNGEKSWENRIHSTNPCGEYAFLDNTACNLASINLLAFYDAKTRTYRLEDLARLISYCQLFLEASIIGGQFPTEDIARNTYMFRTTGLGFANLGSLLMAMGVPYDSPEACALAAGLAALLTGQSYLTSALMAEKEGPFPAWEINAEDMKRVLRNHARAAGVREDAFEGLSYQPQVLDHELLKGLGMEALSKAIGQVWDQALAYGDKVGYRNAQVTVMAPTGTISFAMDCASTGVEPFFSHVVYKKLSGGGYMKLANPMIASGLEARGYQPEEIDDILQYILREENGMIVDGKIEGAPHLKEEDLPVFDTAMSCGSGERYIAPLGHVRMLAAITPLISGAISKTVNLPGTATMEDFAKVTLTAWKQGVKGISLYRDGSKIAQPLNIKLESEGSAKLEDLTYADLLDRAKACYQDKDVFDRRLDKLEEENQDLRDLLAKRTTKMEELERQNEIFASLMEKGGAKVPEAITDPNLSLPPRRTKLAGIRSGRTHPAQVEDVKIYCTVNRNEEGQISEIYITTDREGSLIMGLLNSISKMVSVMLQYHISPMNIAKMLRGQQYEPAGIVTRHPYIKTCSSLSDLIAKIIELEMGEFRRLEVKPGKEFVLEIGGSEPDDQDEAEVDPFLELHSSRQRELHDIHPESAPRPISSQIASAQSKYAGGYAQGGSMGSGGYSSRGDDAEEDPYELPNPTAIYQGMNLLRDGSVCPNCSSNRMVRNGTCKVCLDCGTTTGCS